MFSMLYQDDEKYYVLSHMINASIYFDFKIIYSGFDSSKSIGLEECCL